MADGEKQIAVLSWPGGRGPEIAVSGEVSAAGAEDEYEIIENGDALLILRDGRQTEIRRFDPLDVDVEHDAGGDNVVKAPMHGKLVALFVATGDHVHKGQKIAIIEAMKMEHMLVAPSDGVVHAVGGTVGQQIAQNALVASIGE